MGPDFGTYPAPRRAEVPNSGPGAWEADWVLNDTLVVGIELRLLPTSEGGRRGPLIDVPDEQWRYRPNWQLPTMTGAEQSGAPVLGYSADAVLPGGAPVNAVIAVLVPDMVPRWAAEVVPGVVLPLLEGPRVVGHGTVLWTKKAPIPIDTAHVSEFRSWLDRDRPAARMIAVYDSPVWLPEGSRAEVWRDHRAPSPASLARLVIRRGSDVFCVPRDDGRIDLPAAPVPTHGDSDGRRTAAAMKTAVIGTSGVLQHPVGYVRNIVPEPSPDYPWPSPVAHFTVWATTGEPAVPGQWVPLGPDSPLRDRHWFPLL